MKGLLKVEDLIRIQILISLALNSPISEANVLAFYPLKTLENPWFPDVLKI